MKLTVKKTETPPKLISNLKSTDADSASPFVASTIEGTLHHSSSELSRLKKIKGQVAGLEKMYHDRRYCIDIIQQIRACCSALKSLERETMRKHLQNCVKEAVFHQNPEQVDTKFNEIFNLLK